MESIFLARQLFMVGHCMDTIITIWIKLYYNELGPLG